MSETRALLLTDVVDSTRLAAKLGEVATDEVWAAHDRAARSLLPAWRGREIDKTDGMLLLFEAVSDAVGYALAYQHELSTLPMPLQARAGVHVGPVVLRENRAEDVARGAKAVEVEGVAKPIAARVMSLALGGQILLSGQARRALGEGQWQLRSHGHWMLKGLDDPVELFEVGLDEDDFRMPSDCEKAYRVTRQNDVWLPVQQIPNNLPQQLSSFVGRERERREVRAALEGSRLVTLLGMGGLGKTRLSLHVAVDLLVSFPDGVWFLDLAPIRDPALVVGEAAKVLGVRADPDRSLVQTLCGALRPQRALLIFDNCEHLTKAAAELAYAILGATPNVRILATSREVLHVSGEQSYPVPPLSLPRRGDDLTALARSTAVRLFVERARSHKPTFALTAREAPAVANLVARLEGIPLALELAAARVRVMSVADISARLMDRYTLLTSGGWVQQERHRTLRALVDWSYNLLDEPERTVLSRMAVFVGGCDLEAAEAICGAPPLERAAVLNVVTSLVEKSLVVCDEHTQGTRYRLLETIRDFAHEKLQEVGDVSSPAARHCHHYLAFVNAFKRAARGPEQILWDQRMEAELDNARAGIDYAMHDGGNPIIAVEYVFAMRPFWYLRGHASEGRNLVRACLELPAVQESPRALGQALYVDASLTWDQGDHAEARTVMERCWTLRKALGEPIDIAATLTILALIRLATGDDVDRVCEDQLRARAIFLEHGDRIGEICVLTHVFQIRFWAGQFAQARESVDECLLLARQVEWREPEAECELFFGQLDLESGARQSAREHLVRSIAICKEVVDRRTEAIALWWLGKVDLMDCLLTSARLHLGDALRMFRSSQMREELLGCLEDHACLAHAQGQTALAIQIMSAATASRRRFGTMRSPRDTGRCEEQVELLRRAVASTAFDATWSEGQAWSFDKAVQMALSPECTAVG